MRSLFLKIFISFILITLFASISTIFISQWAQIGPFGELKKRMLHHQFRSLTHTLSVTGLASLNILRNGGEVELLRYLQEVKTPDQSAIFLVKRDESTFSGIKLPTKVQDLAFLARQSRTIQRSKTETELMVALPLFHPGGRGMVMVGVADRAERVPSFFPRNKVPKKWAVRGFFSRPLGLPIPVMVCIAAIGCYFLARSLTSPIRDLRKATQQMSGGDFSARVEGVGTGGDEIADLSRDFNIMAERTESLLQSQKRLLRDISHELRSPLTRQNVALELANQRFPDAEPYLARIAKESNRLNELIDHLLVLTRLEGDAGSSSQETVSLQGLLTDIGRDADFEAASLNRSVICRLADVDVTGSLEMLSRAFENIIRNGVRYTAVETAVEVDVVQVGRDALITVRDHGDGVPEECVGQIFKPFFRVAKSRDRDSGGTGIGLAIARQAILLHGGTIKARNSKTGGLVVEVSLPVKV